MAKSSRVRNPTAKSVAAFNPEKAGGNPTPLHTPNETTRAEVFALSSFGTPQSDIASYIDIDEMTLRKYYRQELDKAATLANKAVAQAIWKQGVELGNVQALIFWAKARMGWADRSVMDHQNLPPGPSSQAPTVNIIIKQSAGQPLPELGAQVIQHKAVPANTDFLRLAVSNRDGDDD